MIGANDGSAPRDDEKQYTMYFCAPVTKKADATRVKAIAVAHLRYRWTEGKH